MNKQDDVLAFPQIKWERDDDGNLYPDEKHGMTLRDYFAAKAMLGIITDPKEGQPFTNDQLAQWAYQVADEMLKAREE